MDEVYRKTKNLFTGKHLRLFEHDGWEFASRKEKPYIRGNPTPDAVIIYARMKEKLLVVRQFRKAAGDFVYELPAGLVDPGESVKDAAIRELREETGLTVTKINSVEYGFSSIGLTDEVHAILHCEVKGKLFTAERIHTEFWTAARLLTEAKNHTLMDDKLAMIAVMVRERLSKTENDMGKGITNNNGNKKVSI